MGTLTIPSLVISSYGSGETTSHSEHEAVAQRAQFNNSPNQSHIKESPRLHITEERRRPSTFTSFGDAVNRARSASIFRDDQNTVLNPAQQAEILTWADRKESQHRSATREVMKLVEEVKAVGSQLRDAKIYDLHQQTLRDWASVISYCLSEIEDRVTDFLTDSVLPMTLTSVIKMPSPRLPFPGIGNSPRRPSAMQSIVVKQEKKSKAQEQMKEDEVMNSSIDEKTLAKRHAIIHRIKTPSTSHQLSHIVFGTLFVVIDTLRHALDCEKTVLYLHNESKNELQSVALSGLNVIHPLVICHSLDSAFSGCSVFKTGIAVNGEETTGKGILGHSMGVLTFPILHASTRKSIGILQCSAKAHNGRFQDEDEVHMQEYSFLISCILLRYSCDFLGLAFDGQTGAIVKDLAAVTIPSRLVTDVGGSSFNLNNRKQLVYRAQRSGEFVRMSEILVGERKGVGSSGRTATLEEVDSYIAKLEQSWQNAVKLNVTYESQQLQITEKMRKAIEKHAKKEDECQTELGTILNLYRGVLPVVAADEKRNTPVKKEEGSETARPDLGAEVKEILHSRLNSERFVELFEQLEALESSTKSRVGSALTSSRSSRKAESHSRPSTRDSSLRFTPSRPNTRDSLHRPGMAEANLPSIDKDTPQKESPPAWRRQFQPHIKTRRQEEQKEAADTRKLIDTGLADSSWSFDYSDVLSPVNERK